VTRIRLAVASLPIAALAAGCPSLQGFAGIGGSDASTADVGIDGADDGGDADDGGSPFEIANQKPGGETFTAIWGADPNHVWVVGTNGARGAFDGQSWHFEQPMPGIDFSGLWGTSPTDIYRVSTSRADGSGLIEHYDGTMWTEEHTTPSALHGLWGSGATLNDYVFATGDQGMVYTKQVGTTNWYNMANDDAGLDPNPVSGISGFGSANLFLEVAGGLNLVGLWHSLGWYLITDNSDPKRVYLAVWQAPIPRLSAFFGTNFFGATLITLTADAGDPAPDGGLVESDLESWDLFEDRSQPVNEQMFMRGIWGTATKTLFVGDQGRIYEYDMSRGPSKWKYALVPSPVNTALWAVWGSSPSDVWIAGENQTILHGSMPN
jgi:hypothetical protein